MKKIFLIGSFLGMFLNLNAQQVIQVNKKNNSPNEPSIYINPANPSQIIAGSNIDNLYVSADSGKTWKETKLTSTLGVYGDPVVYADNKGNFYFCHLSKTEGKQFPNWIDRIIVQKSTDGGNTFNNGVDVGYNGNKAQDKHWIVSDNTNGPNAGNLYLTWTEFDKYDSKKPTDKSRIMFSRSTDGGMSFSRPVIISDKEGDCLDGDNTTEGAIPAVDADGTVYVAWSLSGKIYFDKSTDGGLTFGEDKEIAEQVGGWDIPVSQIFRANAMPFIVTDYSSERHKGSIYLIWGDTRNGDTDIFVKKSMDKGETWTEAKRINDDALSNGRDQFFCHMAVDPIDGGLYAVFYDRRNSVNNLFTDVYVAFSTDGGNTWQNRRITNKAFTPSGKMTFFGDYNNIAAYNGMVRPIWTETTEDFSEDPMKKLIKGDDLVIKTCLLNKSVLVNYNFQQDDEPFYLAAFYNNKNKKLYVHYQLNTDKYGDAKLYLESKNKKGKNTKQVKRGLVGKTDSLIYIGEEIFDLSGAIADNVVVKLKVKGKTVSKKVKIGY